ncbi:MAG: globin [Gammaproteobacteria bacterium]|nr:globin [Gammaproteobacteria bacterium]
MAIRERLSIDVNQEIEILSRYLGTSGHHPDVGEFSEIMAPAKAYWTYPDVISPAPHVFRLAGEQKIRDLVIHHHKLLFESPLKDIFGESEKRFDIIANRTADFHVEACGGPAYYSSVRGSASIGIRHLPFTITEADRELWLDLYAKSLWDTQFPLDAGEIYWRWIESVSLRVINRRGRALPPERVSFNQAMNKARGLAGHAP